MEPAKSHKQTDKSGSEESLTTVLDDEQQDQLTWLIASIMAAMRKTIISNFDANVGAITPAKRLGN